MYDFRTLRPPYLRWFSGIDLVDTMAKKESCSELSHLLGENIRYYRRQAKLTQKQLGEKIGKATIVINRLENGQTGLTLATLSCLASVLKVPPYAFFLPRGLVCLKAVQVECSILEKQNLVSKK